jgi:hypothetical protein
VADNEVRRVEGPGSLKRPALPSQCQTTVVNLQMAAQQTFVDIPKLPNLQIGVVDRPPVELYLSLAASRNSTENEVSQDAG